MDRILLLCFGMMFCSLTSFGQSFFPFKTLPNSSGLFKALPSFPEIRVPGFNWIPNGSGSLNTFPFSGKNKQYTPNISRPLLYSKAKPTIIPYHSNMPMVDLSKGYSSNFPIKKFSKDYPSNMPIVRVITPIPGTRMPGFYDNGFGNRQLFIPK